MSATTKLKEEARRHEQREEWDRAIEMYRQALADVEGEGPGEAELPLFNRIGDLYLRLGKPGEAVGYYEEAAEHYAAAGLFNSAIALCNKALRYTASRASLLKKLAGYCAAQGFLTDARRWLLEFAEVSLRAGEIDEAFSALEEFADRTDDAAVREALAERLVAHDRASEAVLQLRRAFDLHVDAGDIAAAAAARERLAGLVGDEDLPALPPRPQAVEAEAQAAQPPDGEEEAVAADEGAMAGAEESAGAWRTGGEVSEGDLLEPAEPAWASESLAGDVGAEPLPPDLDVVDAAAAAGLEAEAPPEDVTPLPLLEGTAEAAGLGAPPEEEDVAEPLPLLDEAVSAELADAAALIERSEVEAFEREDAADIDAAEAEPIEAAEAEPFEAAEAEPFEAGWAAPAVAEAEATAEVDGGAVAEEEAEEAWIEIRESATAAGADVAPEDSVFSEVVELIARGRGSEVRESLERLHAELDAAGERSRALEALEWLVEIDADDHASHQRRVEYAAALDDRSRLVPALVAMANLLRRQGEIGKAQAIFRHVVELDPGNSEAAAALTREEAPDAFVDLGSLLREESGPETTRYVVQPEPPSGDDYADLAEILQQFRAKVSENLPVDDPAGHYDLGLAYKEMGLVDEAIAEFQVALRGGAPELRVSEEMGQCFMMKGQHRIAARLLERAVKLPHEAGVELLGVYYHLGRCYEELGRADAAREAYERVVGLDVDFRDVRQRLAVL